MSAAIPTLEQPGPVAAADAELAHAEQHAETARERLREADAALSEARALYKQDLAKRIAAGEENPAPTRRHRAKAEAAMEACGEVLAAAESNVAAVRERLDQATGEHAAAGAERVRKARQKLDSDYLKLLDRLAALEQRRAELRAAGDWLTARVTPGQTRKLAPVPGHLDLPHPAHADAKVPATLAIDKLRGYIEDTTVEAEAAAVEQEAAREAEAEQRRAAAALFADSAVRPS